MEELLAAHQHAIERIAAIYEFFRMFSKAHGNDVDVLVGEQRDITLITYVRLSHSCVSVRIDSAV